MNFFVAAALSFIALVEVTVGTMLRQRRGPGWDSTIPIVAAGILAIEATAIALWGPA